MNIKKNYMILLMLDKNPIDKNPIDENPIDENLKDTKPLKWTGLMNNYKDSAEEIIFKELIYC